MIRHCGVYGIDGKWMAQVNESSAVEVQLDAFYSLVITDEKLVVTKKFKGVVNEIAMSKLLER